MSVEEFKHILRIAGKDIEGSRKSVVALSEVKGVGYNLSQVILQSLNINPYLRVGFLTDKELSDIENALKNIRAIGVPKWYLNRQKDMDSGTDIHLITSDLDFTQSNDIEREKSVMSWRGYRHVWITSPRSMYEDYWQKSDCGRSKESSRKSTSWSWGLKVVKGGLIGRP